MDEADIRLEMQHAIRKIGFDDHHPEDSRQTGRGRPDIFGLNPIDRTIVIEVKKIEEKKRVDSNLYFKEISNSQRKWLDWWVHDRTGAGFLGLGTVFGKPRQMWIIPWHRWAAFELWKVKETGNEYAELNEINTYFREKEHYALEWVNSTEGWAFLSDHPLMKIKRSAHTFDEWSKIYSWRSESKETNDK